VCNYELSNALGFDLEITYNSKKVTATENIEISNALISSDFVSYTVNITKGIIRVSMYLNGNGGNATFNGSGIIAHIEFTKTALFNTIDSTSFWGQITESYETKTQLIPIQPKNFKTYSNNYIKGYIEYAASNAALENDKQSPIIINDSLTILENGSFTLPIETKTITIAKKRDVSANMLASINSNDAYLTALVTTKNTKFIPTIQQIIAMDVNRDGIISAGDISQINKRITNEITTYNQAPKIAVDWLFVSKKNIENKSLYKISTIYPACDGVGFCKEMVPIVPSNIEILESDNCNENNNTFYAILIGDVDGSYKNENKNLHANSPLKSETKPSGSTLFKTTNTKGNNGDEYFDLDVNLNFSGSIYNFDFTLENNNPNLEFVEIITSDKIPNIKYNNDTKNNIVRITGYRLNEIQTSEHIVRIRYRKLQGADAQFTEFYTQAYINGIACESEVMSNSFTAEIASYSAYPNPVNNEIKIDVSQVSNIIIVDAMNQVKYKLLNADPNKTNTINVSKLTKGVYFIKVFISSTEVSSITFIKE